PTKTQVPIAARVLAGFALPSVALLILGPAVVRYAPREVETAWFASLVLAILGCAAAVWCAAGSKLEGERTSPRFMLYGVGAIFALIAMLFVTGTATGNTMQSLASMAQGAGFRVLPGLLRHLDFAG